MRDHYLATFGPEHPETLKAMHNLASSYSEAGRRDDAVKLLDQALLLNRRDRDHCGESRSGLAIKYSTPEAPSLL